MNVFWFLILAVAMVAPTLTVLVIDNATTKTPPAPTVESSTRVDGHEMIILIDTTTGVRYLSYRSGLTILK